MLESSDFDWRVHNKAKLNLLNHFFQLHQEIVHKGTKVSEREEKKGQKSSAKFWHSRHEKKKVEILRDYTVIKYLHKSESNTVTLKREESVDIIR